MTFTNKMILISVTSLTAVFVVAGIAGTAHAEYCIESNGGTLHCFPSDYNSNHIDYSYVGVDITNDYWHDQDDPLVCYGDDYRCLNVDGSSKYDNYDDYDYGSYSDTLDNGCYADLPYLHSDGYCYDYPGFGSEDYRPYDTLDNGYPEPIIKRSVNGTTWGVYDSKNNFYSWSFDAAGYEDLVINGNNLSIHHTENPFSLTDNYGNEIITTGLDYFVYGAFGDGTVDEIYYNSDSSSDFIWEVWNIVSQLTEYSSDRDDGYYVGDEGRYALDTLYRGGGDCEDLAILIADMLVSTKHTEDWTIQYVYMDGDNPTDPTTVNHVILYVNDGTRDYLIEATAPPSWDYFPNGVSGWHFDV